MVKKVQARIARFAMFAPGDRVAAAVSGGCDSVALLHCLAELAEKFAVSIRVIHVNHRLRGSESDGDERFAAKLAAERGLPFESARLDAAQAARRSGHNLEQVARRLRYDWFSELLREGRFDKIATGHTQSDQAETVLFRLLRGAGGPGLAGIRPVLWGRIVRPLLDVTRQDVLRYLKSKGVEWREDVMNKDLDFARNRIRHELLPQLEREWNPSLSAVLAHTAEWARGEEEYWTAIVDGLAAKHLESRGGSVELDVPAARELPVAALRRLIRRAIEQARGTLAGFDFEHIERVRALCVSPSGTGRADLPGLEARRSQALLRLTCRAQSANSRGSSQSDYRLEVAAPGDYPLPGGQASIRVKVNQIGRNGVYTNSGLNLLDWEKVRRPIYLRNWTAGDRFEPSRGGAKKLKVLFQRYRVPVWDRDGWPVLAASSWKGDRTISRDSETVVWTRKFGVSAAFAANPDSRVVAEISEIEQGRNLGNQKRK